MRRQSIRRGLILISFLLFPITIFYFSPVLIITAARLGIVNGSLIAFVVLFLSALCLGRAFCGWVCPGSGLQEACLSVNSKKTIGGKANWIKYVIWVPWLGTIILFAIKAGGYRTIDPLYQTHHGISIAGPMDYVPFFIVIGLIVIPSIMAGKRAFCHYICWMAPFMVLGRKLRNGYKWPALHLVAESEKCVDCRKCSKICPMSLDVNDMVANESLEHSECTLCGSCIDGCPQNVIQYAFKTVRN